MLPLLALRANAQTGVYPDSTVRWEDREELVQGGCKPGTKEGTACYDGWNAKMLEKILQAPSANTIVLLSVGAGVIELRAVKLAIELRNDGDTRIDQVWLVDPGLDKATGDQVASNYAAALEGVDVHYFSEDGAYTRAIERQTSSPRMASVVGALNMSLGMFGTHPKLVAQRNEVLEFVTLLASALPRDGAPLHVVQSWYNEREGYIVRDQTATEFVNSRRREMEQHIELLNRMQQRYPLQVSPNF